MKNVYQVEMNIERGGNDIEHWNVHDERLRKIWTERRNRGGTNKQGT